MVVAVYLDYCFIWLPWQLAISRAIWPNSMIKSNWRSLRDLISAWNGSLCSLSIWRVLIFEIFHSVKTLFVKMAASFLSALIPDWVRSALRFFSENTWILVETCCLSMGFESMKISFKSKSLTNLSDSKLYNCLRFVPFAICFTPLSSKISSVFSVCHKLQIFFS